MHANDSSGARVTDLQQIDFDGQRRPETGDYILVRLAAEDFRKMFFFVAFVHEMESRKSVVSFSGYLERCLSGADPGFCEDGKHTLTQIKR